MKSKARKIKQLSAGFLVGILAIWGFIYSCEKEDIKPVYEFDQPVKVANSEAKIEGIIGKVGQQSDPVTINELIVRENLLIMHIEYAGGCQPHDFEFIGSSRIDKSLPPQRTVQLVHHANNDECRMLLSTVLTVDLTQLAYEQKAGSEIYLNLDGWKSPIYYSFFEQEIP